MRRLCVFCFFDEDGIVDSYIDYLLHDLSQNVQQLIVVVNGEINDDGIKIFRRYTEKIVIRENKGFDAGAYKKILVDILGENEMKKWDEIVLCNDTFYGPFTPFREIFDKMQQQEIDFWGLNHIDNDFLSHIQSYFLVFKRNILLSGDLINYFKKNIDMETDELTDIYTYFELGLYSYLKEKGYRYGVYSHLENYDIYRSPGVCIEIYGFPVFKKRCFSPTYFKKISMLNLLYYIQNEKQYDINLILSNMYRLYNIKITTSDILNSINVTNEYVEEKVPACVEKSKVLEFIKKYQKIYIYGTGCIAKHVWFFFHKDISVFAGFIISDEQEISKPILYGYPVRHYKEIKEGSSIILGVSRKNSQVIIPHLKKQDKVLFLWSELIH